MDMDVKVNNKKETMITDPHDSTLDEQKIGVYEILIQTDEEGISLLW